MKKYLSFVAVLVLGFAFTASAATYTAQPTVQRAAPPPPPPPTNQTATVIPPTDGSSRDAAVINVQAVGSTNLTPVSLDVADPQGEQAAHDMFLKLEGVKGEAAPAKGAATDRLQTAGPQDGNAIGSATGGAGTGKIKLREEDAESSGGVQIAAGDVNGDGQGAMQGGISIAAGDVNGLTAEGKAAFLTTVKTYAEVRSQQDLADFARGVLLNDDSVRAVKIDGNAVEVQSNEAAKLFGVIPVPFKIVVTTDLDASGTDRVKVKLPWWHFLATTDFDAPQFQTMIDSALNLPDDHNLLGLRAYTLLQVSIMLKTRHDTAKNSIGNIR